MAGRIRIAHLVNYLSSAGKEMGIIKLLNALDDQLFESYLIVLDRVFETLDLNLDKIKMISLDKGPGNDWRLPFRLARILKEHKIDIMHGHAWGTLVEGVLGAKLARVPVVIHGEHGSFHKDFKRRMVQKIFFRWSDRVLSVSEVLADNLSDTIGVNRDHFTTILNGVDTDRFQINKEWRQHYRKKHNLSPDTILIGTVGRTMPVKNHPLFIRAIARLKEKGYPVRAAIIGQSRLHTNRPELEGMVNEYDLDDQFQFWGPQEDIPGYLNAFDIFVLPSLSEGCSNVIQEAMATGLPVVASRVGGNPELIEDGKTGLLFKSNDISEFVTKLERLIEDRELMDTLGKAGREHALKNFSLDTMVRSYQSLYLRHMNHE